MARMCEQQKVLYCERFVCLQSCLIFDSTSIEMNSRWLPAESPCDVEKSGFMVDNTVVPCLLIMFVV